MRHCDNKRLSRIVLLSVSLTSGGSSSPVVCMKEVLTSAGENGGWEGEPTRTKQENKTQKQGTDKKNRTQLLLPKG